MTDTNDVAVPSETPAPPEKKKRGRPKKVEGEKATRRPNRDVFAEAFGDKRASVAVKALPKGPEKKAVIVAVKLWSKSKKKRERFDSKKKDLEAKIVKLQKKIADNELQAKKVLDAAAAIDAIRPRIARLIVVLCGEADIRPLVEVPVAVPASNNVI